MLAQLIRGSLVLFGGNRVGIGKAAGSLFRRKRDRLIKTAKQNGQRLCLFAKRLKRDHFPALYARKD
jgi:hypothetical protein